MVEPPRLPESGIRERDGVGMGSSNDFNRHVGAPFYERLVKELANLAFVSEGTIVLLLEPLGIGKINLTVPLTLK